MKLTAKKFPFLEDYRLPHGYNIVKRKRKLADEQFHIVTLGDRNSLREGDIVTGAIGWAIDQVMSLFGGRNDQVTAADWNRLLPGSGYWTNKYRAYLSKHIYFADMMWKIPLFTQYYVHQNMAELSGGKYLNLDQNMPPGEFSKYEKLFYEKLQAEQGGNNQYIKTGSSGLDNLFAGGSSTTTIIIIGAAIGLLLAMTKKGK